MSSSKKLFRKIKRALLCFEKILFSLGQNWYTCKVGGTNKNRLFKKTWINPGLFSVYFHPFQITITIIQIEKSEDSVLGIRTNGRIFVGADKTTELWKLPCKNQHFKGRGFVCAFHSVVIGSNPKHTIYAISI